MRRSRWRRWGVKVILMTSGATMFGACNGPLGREFRSVAGTGLQSGVTTIATSVIDGIFAILTPNPTTSDTV